VDVPSTVSAALEDRPVEGAVCLEAGAGVGNAATAGCHLVVDDYAPLPEGSATHDLFAGHGWAFDRERTLLDPVPWTASHVEADAEGESAGEMYSLAMRLPNRDEK
jgi:hypothetical protein